MAIIDSYYELYHDEFVQRGEIFAPPVHGLALIIGVVADFVCVTDVFVVYI